MCEIFCTFASVPLSDTDFFPANSTHCANSTALVSVSFASVRSFWRALSQVDVRRRNSVIYSPTDSFDAWFLR